MTTIRTETRIRRGFVRAGEHELWYEQRGEGPDVLLIGGGSDTVESWEPQLAGLSDRYRLTAFDNRGAGRSPRLERGPTAAELADDAAGVLRGLGIERAHIAGFSMGSVIAQEVVLRHPELARSLVVQGTWPAPDAHLRAVAGTWRWMFDAAPDERSLLEAFFLWVYTPRARVEGLVDAIIEAALEFEHPQPPDQFLAQMDVALSHDATDRLHTIAVPTLVLAGSIDPISPPHLGAEVARRIPGATFRIQDGESHQPFQERPEEWNATVDAFWRSVA